MKDKLLISKAVVGAIVGIVGAIGLSYLITTGVSFLLLVLAQSLVGLDWHPNPWALGAFVWLILFLFGSLITNSNIR
jgi:hypothetical protein